MKKMHNGNFVCEAIVESGFTFCSEVECMYDNETIAYAVERFLVQCPRFVRECTNESWQVRIAKGKERRPRRFTYLVPGILMELPGEWVRLTGDIDAVGIKIKKVELLREHPCFAKNSRETGK